MKRVRKTGKLMSVNTDISEFLFGLVGKVRLTRYDKVGGIPIPEYRYTADEDVECDPAIVGCRILLDEWHMNIPENCPHGSIGLER